MSLTVNKRLIVSSFYFQLTKDEFKNLIFHFGTSSWGDKGYGYLSFAYIERYMMDAWSSVDIEDPNPLTLARVLSYQARALGQIFMKKMLTGLFIFVILLSKKSMNSIY